MHKLTKLTLTAVALAAFAFAAPAAFAVECNTNQGTNIELDFQRGLNNRPMLNLELRVIGERCVDGPTVYHLKGMVGNFGSKGRVLEAFKTVQSLKQYKLTAEEVVAILKFVNEQEATVATAEKAPPPK